MQSFATTAGVAARRPFLTLSRLFALLALQRSRRQLARLDDHLLRDVGLSRSEARREVEKPMWNAPDHWVR